MHRIINLLEDYRVMILLELSIAVHVVACY